MLKRLKISECVTYNHRDQDEYGSSFKALENLDGFQLTNFYEFIRLADGILRPLVIPRTHDDTIHPLLSEKSLNSSTFSTIFRNIHFTI